MDNVLEKIHKAALKFLVPLTSEETYEMVVKEAIRLVDAQIGSIFLPDKITGELTRVYTTDLTLHNLRVRKKGLTYQAYKTHQLILTTNVQKLHRIHVQFRELSLKSVFSIPLSYKNRSIGVLSLLSLKSKLFTKKELDILKLFGSMASLAIRKTQLYDESKKALEARDLFISMAAHELRTPITTISGYSQLLYSKFAGTNTTETRWIEDLSWETIRLTYLVNELLEVDRIKAGQLQYTFRECSLREVIRRSLSDFSFTHPEHKIIFNDKLNGKNDLVIGDFDKLLQAIINLLNNAAKFSSSQTEIIINLKAKSSFLILEIQDQGKGITQKDLPEIFEKFYKGSDHSKEGMGLGLFLVKNIVERHHGSLRVNSKQNKGTRVEIQIPHYRQ